MIRKFLIIKVMYYLRLRRYIKQRKEVYDGYYKEKSGPYEGCFGVESG